MPSSPRELLAQALETTGNPAQIAHKAGVTARDIANAQVARPVSTIPFLRICVAIQHDPLPSLPHLMPEKPSDFDFEYLAIAFHMKRTMEKDTEAAAALRMDIMPVTICRMERGDRLLFGVVARACQYIGIHPFGYLSVSNTPAISAKIEKPKRPRVSRETLPVVLSPLGILVKQRDGALRRAEMVGRALERLEGTEDYRDAFNRHQRYLASVAALTLSIDLLRQAEGKEVRVLGSLSA